MEKSDETAGRFTHSYINTSYVMLYSDFTTFYYILLLGFMYISNVELCKKCLKLIERLFYYSH